MVANMTFLVSAGLITATDNKLMFIQGLDDKEAVAIAEWLAVATGTPVCLRHINLHRRSAEDIRKSPEDIVWKEMLKTDGMGST